MRQCKAVILSGGSGTRLWPLSREAYPKQFLALTGDHSLLQETLLRFQALAEADPDVALQPPAVICNEAHRFLVAEQLRELGFAAGEIILEPAGRNTAPALTVAALLSRREGDDPVLAVMPSDHVIRDRQVFCATLAEAIQLAEQGYLVTFGIVPTRPETGFGYIRVGKPLQGHARLLDRFVEKPDRKTADSYLASGDYLWNSGIFVMRASVWLEAIGKFRHDILAACRLAVENGREDADFFRLDRDAFAACPADSIDYAVMERLSGSDWQAAVLPLEAGWSDLGSWPAMWEVADTDADGNITHGDVFLHEVKDSLVHANDRFVAALGVQDLIVAETADAILVAHKDSAQQVRKVAEYLKSQGRYEYLHHLKIHRPWGTIETIGRGDRYQVNRLTVRPGAHVATQLHHHRAEHWVVVKGTARITRGVGKEEETFLLTENQSTYIPVGVRHRLENPGKIPLEVIEVQSGAYLGGDDILRFDEETSR
ncbi:mannose-1-phosphate guanylyltransferase/mannose-6-phosphate isomerase [Methylomarinovum tepidoasis]|uniref:mannose-1-phosphate guanylyltransferase n=1 Tax=Methylomarinovum tepidoasis TaxID=2840183 RepID=A0AAU9C0C8_9GAMM|nr:mannose-1-phosphate guanylyltransferase/mannose-6-phosphate isomerase [Methylomarinovum sp. IN45]BCX89525.1 mannose-1-phosphate guanylyltransferase/mannose-6-phosphate isomerase [Methylomarinovum sp. IN45]